MTERGTICWADLGEARGSKPARRRPVLVIQSDPFNASRLNTTIAAVITSNTALAAMPGNVFLPAAVSGLPKDSVINVTALVTLDKTDLEEPVGYAPASLMDDVDRGLRRVLGPLTATRSQRQMRMHSGPRRQRLTSLSREQGRGARLETFTAVPGLDAGVTS